MKPRFTKEEIIKKFNGVHGDVYDYSKFKYVKAITKSIIICHKHGEFLQHSNSHLSGKGCPYCGDEKIGNKLRYNNEKFIKISNEIHCNKYNYSLIEYKTNHEKVKIICPIHGIFEQEPKHHVAGHGCEQCSSSRGEKIIERWLIKNNILFVMQKRFDNCRGKKLKLPFDFYLPAYNICIEYDGEQHFTGWSHKKENFIKLNNNDNIKNEFCKKENIKLLRIPYTEFNRIENILNTFLFC